MTSLLFRTCSKAQRLAVVCALSLCSATAFAAENNDQPYLRLDGGISILQDLELEISTPTGSASGEAEFDTGYRFDLGIGYLMRRGALLSYRSAYANFDIAAELTAGLVYNQAKQIDETLSGGANTSMDLYQVPVLANIVFRFPLSERFYFGLGGGIGPSVSLLDADVSGTTIQDQKVVFAWQARAEAAYFLTDRLSAGVLYKLLGTTDTSFSDDVDLEMDGTMNHFLGLTVSWLF